LACGAAAETEIVEARGWRVPLYLGGGLAALATLGVILAIVALASRNDEVAKSPTPTPSPLATAPPTAAAPTTTAPPLQTTTPSPSVTSTPGATETTTPVPSATTDPNTGTGTGSTFPGWTGQDGDYTVIIKSSTTRSGAEATAQQAQNAGEDVGILKSDDYSSLNKGYYVVFSGVYATEDEAEAALDDLKSSYHDAYIRQIKQ
jgi:septal ring-binding cell division protein DamX